MPSPTSDARCGNSSGRRLFFQCLTVKNLGAKLGKKEEELQKMKGTLYIQTKKVKYGSQNWRIRQTFFFYCHNWKNMLNLRQPQHLRGKRGGA